LSEPTAAQGTINGYGSWTAKQNGSSIQVVIDAGYDGICDGFYSSSGLKIKTSIFVSLVAVGIFLFF